MLFLSILFSRFQLFNFIVVQQQKHISTVGYRAQRLYVQLLPKSMLIAILIGNGIRFQSSIALCPEKGFFMSYFTRHKGCMSISEKSSEHKGCMSFSGKSSEHKGCMSTFVL